ncbi:TasA family protein [Aquibacillus kalidii]|uniref:TasA family protein n=1 Tax=Aquibacillus kalidii TaxID=2762597 RepID=UPI001647D54F|nr:TasA family protein [Aquibacillus kalidii]
MKKKLAIGIMLSLIGLSLIIEGSYAYFSDTNITDGSFSSGYLELDISQGTIMQTNQMMPGDIVESTLQLSNRGSIDIKKVLLHTTFKVIDNGKANTGDDLGKHIYVELLRYDKQDTVIFQKNLTELTNSPEKILDSILSGSNTESFTIRFTLLGSIGNENHFQEDKLEINWDFEAKQRDGRTGPPISTHASFHDLIRTNGYIAIGSWNQDDTNKLEETKITPTVNNQKTEKTE